jgi:glycolate oxidase iron-sulfur subunit
MAASDLAAFDKPQQSDLDRCVHCGLCLNACPTYRELRVEMDSPRGRIYQMAQVANGAAITASYLEHIDLCLACRGCETACPSGVQYGRLVEAARADIENRTTRPLFERMLRSIVFRGLLPSRLNLAIAGALLFLYQASGLKWLTGMLGFLPARLREVESLAPEIETPFFFAYYGKRCRLRVNASIVWDFLEAVSRISASLG